MRISIIQVGKLCRRYLSPILPCHTIPNQLPTPLIPNHKIKCKTTQLQNTSSYSNFKNNLD